MKRILFCIASMKGGGAERQLTYLCKGLVEKEWNVRVALLDTGPNMSRLKATGANVELLNHRTNYDPRIIFQLIKVINEFNPDIVHTWLLAMDIMGGIASTLTNKTFIGSERNTYDAYERKVKNMLRLMLFSLSASVVIANSNPGKKYILENLINPLPVYTIPNGLPIKEIKNTQILSKDRFNLDDYSEVILFAGSFSPQKNLKNLFKAIPSIFAARPNSSVILCGDGPLRDSWMKWVKKNGLGHRIKFPGYVENLWGLMKSVDMFILPSFFEGQPNVVLEAMVCKCPLVVSDIPAHKQFLDDQSALFFPPHEPSKLSKMAIKVLENPVAAKKRANHASIVASKWSVEKLSKEYTSIYREFT